MASEKFSSVDEYIASFPEEVQAILNKLRQTIRDEMPEAGEKISYGIPTFMLNDKYVVYFAGWKDYISLYPLPSGDAELQKEIAPYKSGRGTARFSLDKPIPYDLVKKIVEALIRDSAERTGAY
jgi:uncharacterized protein YdhG (YjbR/CyaY superfamily)